MPSVDALPDETVQDPGMKKALERAEEIGLPDPWLVRLFARAPDQGRALVHMLDVMENHGALPPRLLHLVSIFIADSVGDDYGKSVRLRAGGQYAEQDIVAAALGDYDTDSRLSRSEQLALRFAEQMLLDHEKIGGDFYELLRQEFTEAEVIELGWFIVVNYGLSTVVSSLGPIADTPDG